MGRKKAKQTMTNSYGTILNSYKEQNKAHMHKWLKEKGLLPIKKKKKKKKISHLKTVQDKLSFAQKNNITFLDVENIIKDKLTLEDAKKNHKKIYRKKKKGESKFEYNMRKVSEKILKIKHDFF